MGAAHAEAQKQRGYQETKNTITKSSIGHFVHHFSSFVSSRDFSSSIPSMILISDRCPVSTSVAKLKSSASCPAPAVSNKFLTIVSAPLWCCTIPVRNKRSNSVAFALRSASICSGVSMPGIRCAAPCDLLDMFMPCVAAIPVEELDMEMGSPRAASQRCINLISSDCERL